MNDSYEEEKQKLRDDSGTSEDEEPLNKPLLSEYSEISHHPKKRAKS